MQLNNITNKIKTFFANPQQPAQRCRLKYALQAHAVGYRLPLYVASDCVLIFEREDKDHYYFKVRCNAPRIAHTATNGDVVIFSKIYYHGALQNRLICS